MKTTKTLPLAFVIMTLMLSAVQPVMASPAPQQGMPDSNGVYDPVTGALAFVGSAAGQPLASPQAGLTAETFTQTATTFASVYAGEMGLSDVAAELVPAQTVPGLAGHRSIRYHQLYQGLPVFASDVFVNLTATGAISSLTAKTSPNLGLDIHPAVTAAQATDAAFAAVADNYHLAVTDLVAATPELQIYDSRLLHLDTAPQLVWKLVVTSPNQPVDDLVLIDAQDGSVALQYSEIDSVSIADTQASQLQPGNGNLALVSAHTRQPGLVQPVLGAPQISVYDLAGAMPDIKNAPLWTVPGMLACDQDTAANCASDTDKNNAYLNVNDFYNFFVAHHGRDSFDGLGSRINTHVHYGTSGALVFFVDKPVNSAVYSPGSPVAIDLAGHAMTFGFTASTSNLVLAYQPGAISESLADMWGEFIQQTSSRSTVTPATRWLIGENSPAGASRSMKDPTSIGTPKSPDKMSSPYYYKATTDFGGIHYNAGINSKAVYLMTDGGSFNKQNVRALGMEKVIDIYYEAQTQLLSSASTYFDLYYALQQACTNLVGIDGGGGTITSDDCAQVTKALNAVEMNKSIVVAPVATYCPANTKGRNLFSEGFESGLSNWSFYNLVVDTSQWTVTNVESPEGLNHLHAPEPGKTSAPVAQMLTAVYLPPKRTSTYLYFRHRLDLERSTATKPVYFDGGVLQYSLNGGATWLSAIKLFNGGLGYTGVISPLHANPLKGQQAFVGLKGDYVSSRYNISSLAGRNVQFRWVLGTDNQNGAGTGTGGWDLDSIQIYNCVIHPSKPVLTLPLNRAILAAPPLLDWSDSTPDLDRYEVQVSLVGNFSSTVVDTFVTGSQYKISSLDPNKKYFWRVSALNSANQTLGWTPARYFSISLVKPVLLSPPNGAVLKTSRPDFDWSDSVNAAKYTIQISRFSSFSVLLLTGTSTSSSYTPTKALPALTTLFWRVKAVGTYPSNWSQVRRFKTGNAASTPALIVPAINSVVTTPLTLTWNKVSLPKGVVFGHYQVQVDDNSDFSSPLVDDSSVTNINGASLTVSPALTSGTQYYWRIQAWSSKANYSNWSPTRVFTAQ
jgi:Zn-dependent metalloprotease